MAQHDEDNGPVLMDPGAPWDMVPIPPPPAPNADKLAKARKDIEDIARLCGWS